MIEESVYYQDLNGIAPKPFGVAKRVCEDSLNANVFTYAEVKKLSISFKASSEITPQRIMRAIVDGCHDLKMSERFLLITLVSRLTMDQIKSGECYVWMGNWLICQKMGGISQRTLARLKQSLEHKGLLVRHYDHRNRPVEGGALDLRPLLKRLPELLEKGEALFNQSKERFEAQRESTTSYADMADSYDRGGCHQSHPNSHNLTEDVSVQGEEEKEPLIAASNDDLQVDEAPACIPDDGTEADMGLPKVRAFWRGCGQLGSQRHRTAVEQLKVLRVIDESFGQLIDDHSIESGDVDAILCATAAYVDTHFAPKRNPRETLIWGLRKHGWKACLIAVLAQADDSILKPDNWFGFMCSRDQGALDLTENLERVLKVEAKEQAAEVAEQENEQLAGIAREREAAAAEQKRLLDEGKAQWKEAVALVAEEDPDLYKNFLRNLVFAGCKEGVLYLSSQQKFIFDHALRDRQAWLQILETVGLIVNDIRYAGKPRGGDLS
ncbi:hypothetical protein [Kiloniella sp. b19]|uniref:hypothetical protein n=1 Tax=Kiloniella sp. GXU_MW_B19 TaxID=3141326 RepID=UPI0031D5ED0C